MSLPGAKVGLREFRPTDLDDVCSIVGDPLVTWWLSFDTRDQDQARAMLDDIIEKAQQEPRTEYYLAVTPRKQDRVIGFARLALTGVQAAKLGFAIKHDEWGQGYATDAARTLVEFGFGQLKLHRISAAIGPHNAASMAVINRLGFLPEGHIRHHVFSNGEWRDSVLFSVLAEEWTGRAAAGTNAWSLRQVS